MMQKEATRPRDANQLAKCIVDVAIQECEEATVEVDPVTAFTQANGRKGGVSRAANLTPSRR